MNFTSHYIPPFSPRFFNACANHPRLRGATFLEERARQFHITVVDFVPVDHTGLMAEMKALGDALRAAVLECTYTTVCVCWGPVVPIEDVVRVCVCVVFLWGGGCRPKMVYEYVCVCCLSVSLVRRSYAGAR